MNFTYFMPTRIISGHNCLQTQHAHFAHLGQKALIVTGAHSAKSSGALDATCKALQANNQEYVIFDKVMANPTIDCVLEGAAIARNTNCDFVFAIGGGSPLDAGKAMAAAAVSPEVTAHNIFTFPYENALPCVALPTTAGTGSEVTPYAILTNHKAETKTSLATPHIFPRYTYLDGSFMLSLPQNILINTVIDALSHAIEGMLALRANTFTDTLAKESITRIAPLLPKLHTTPLNIDQCQELLWASTLAGMVIANTATVALHAMGYPLTYFKGIDHGRANGLLFAAFMQHVQKQMPEKVHTILTYMNLSSIDAFASILNNLLEPQAPLSQDECRHFVQKCKDAKNMKNSTLTFDEHEIYEIFRQL